MPKQYEAMRDKFKSEGMSEPAAKTKAAKIYNADPKHKGAPVTNEMNLPSKKQKNPGVADPNEANESAASEKGETVADEKKEVKKQGVSRPPSGTSLMGEVRKMAMQRMKK